MGKCDFPGCKNEPLMPFRCNRCEPPKYYCSDHRLPVNHDCVGIIKYVSTQSSVAQIAIGYQKGGTMSTVGGSGYASDIEKFGPQVTPTPAYTLEEAGKAGQKPTSWFGKLKERIARFFKFH